MGTRADFYIGRGENAEWLGSVAWDGYEWDADPNSSLMSAKTPDEFRAAVVSIQSERRDFTAPDEGWPWPWDDSRTTDYAYVLHDGTVTAYRFGYEASEADDDDATQVDWFPDMSDRQNVQWGDKGGIILLR